MKYFDHDEPLGMPKGSVRALVVLFLLLSTVAAWHRGMEIKDAVDLLGIAFAFYFITRAVNGNNS